MESNSALLVSAESDSALSLSARSHEYTPLRPMIKGTVSRDLEFCFSKVNTRNAGSECSLYFSVRAFTAIGIHIQVNTGQKESENDIKSHSKLETGEKCVVALFFFS